MKIGTDTSRRATADARALRVGRAHHCGPHMRQVKREAASVIFQTGTFPESGDIHRRRVHCGVSIILPPDEAREERLAWNAFPDPKGFEDATPEALAAAEFTSRRSYDGDLLDLLSLVSDSCAERAWALLGITREEGERRRDAFRRHVGEALRLRDRQQGSE